MITGFRRVVKAGFIGFWRSAYVSLAAVFVLTVALFVIGATMFLDQLLSVSLNTLQSKVDMNVYFVPNAPQGEIERIETALKALPDVESVAYTSREDALRAYREANQNNEIAMQALEELNENPLGAKLSIQAVDTSRYGQIASFLEEQQALESPSTPVIDEIDYDEDRKDAINKLTAIIDAVESASLLVMLVLLVAAALITFNTIRLAIYTAREEISIMRLVGASNMFIRGPFMLQGIMYGVSAAFLAMLIFYPILLWIGPGTETFFEFNLLTYYLDNLIYIFAVLASIGIVLGLISSIFAIARYLRT